MLLLLLLLLLDASMCGICRLLVATMFEER
jgi:hypothetical protein